MLHVKINAGELSSYNQARSKIQQTSINKHPNWAKLNTIMNAATVLPHTGCLILYVQYMHILQIQLMLVFNHLD